MTNKRNALFVCLAVVLLGLVLVLSCHIIAPSAPATTTARTAATAPSATAVPVAAQPEQLLTMMTWNLRGYPEKDPVAREWFDREIQKLAPDVFCVQEIANQHDVDTFLSTEREFTQYAFRDSADGQDNAIFAAETVELDDMPDPEGFQHPAQEAYVSCRGFDAVVVTVHLSWTNKDMREHEKQILQAVVAQALQKDPDVIVVGDFNTTEPDIEELAGSIGMKVMVPAGQDSVGTTQAGNRYDYFLVSPDLATEEAVGCHIETFQGEDLKTAKEVSDHLPVVAQFRTDARFRDRK